MTQSDVTTHRFEADVNQVLSLVVNSLYSNTEIFLRELVSNASDALDKLRFRAITEPELIDDDPELRIRLIPDSSAGTLTVWDNGVGMTQEELVENLGTVARSGSREFIEKLAEGKAEDVALIGQFGVGFYSSYLAADRVEVISRAAGQPAAHRWSSDAGGTFEVGLAEREMRGTSVILHLKDEAKEYTDEWRLRELVTKYSDFVGHPIELRVERPAPTGEPQEEGDAAPAPKVEFETINQARALWKRPATEISDEQYTEFYKHLAHDWEPPLAHTHFHIEGTQLFTGLLFFPKRRPWDLFDREQRHGLRLYVKRVFIMDDCKELLPPWLRFLRGVIDSDDLPLNVSRELLQDSRIIRTIRKQVVKKALARLEEMAENQPKTYLEFWSSFGVVLKEGLHFDPSHSDQLAKLMRFATSAQDQPTSLADYIARLKEGQKAIYYALGASRALVENSPHLEALKQRGYEVLYMTDPVDQWALDNLSEFDGKPLVSAMRADLELDRDDVEGAGQGDDEAGDDKRMKGLREVMESVLRDHIESARVSSRLTDSPVCLVIPEGGLPPHIERLIRLNQQEVAKQKRILEINPHHPLVHGLERLLERDGESETLRTWIKALYDQALLSEGSPLEEPARFATTLTSLLQSAVDAEVGEEAQA